MPGIDVGQYAREIEKRCEEQGIDLQRASRDYTMQSGVEITQAGAAKSALVRVQGVMFPWMGVDAKKIVAELDKANPKSIRVVIDSVGGSVFTGHSILADLFRRQDNGVEVTTEVAGVAFSAGFNLFLASSTSRIVRKNVSSLMIHGPSTCYGACGTRADIDKVHQRVTSALTAIEKICVDLHESRTSATAEQRKTWLTQDNYFTASEAIDLGIATDMTEDEPENQTPSQLADEMSLYAGEILTDAFRQSGGHDA